MNTLGNVDVGQCVWLQVDGSYTPFRVLHRGKPDDSYDDSFLGGTILCLDCEAAPYITQQVADTSAEKGNYAQSWLHQDLNQNWLAKLAPAIREQVMEVRLPYRTDTDGAPYEVAQGSEGLPAKIWLLSAAEVTEWMEYEDGHSDLLYVQEGVLLDYWRDAELRQYMDWQCFDDHDINMGWTLRTPNYAAGMHGQAPYFLRMMGAGAAWESVTNQAVCRPCLVLPDSLTVDGDDHVHLPGAAQVKVEGVWSEGTVFCRQNGLWSEAAAMAVKVDGAWKE